MAGTFIAVNWLNGSVDSDFWGECQFGFDLRTEDGYSFGSAFL